jgi:hypothetical protein
MKKVNAAIVTAGLSEGPAFQRKKASQKTGSVTVNARGSALPLRKIPASRSVSRTDRRKPSSAKINVV